MTDALPTWWTISGDDLMAMLREVADGADPEWVYLEHYANSDVSEVEEGDG